LVNVDQVFCYIFVSIRIGRILAACNLSTKVLHADYSGLINRDKQHALTKQTAQCLKLLLTLQRRYDEAVSLGRYNDIAAFIQGRPDAASWATKFRLRAAIGEIVDRLERARELSI